MIWACDEFCSDSWVDPFTGEMVAPRELMPIWPDDTCRCGARLEGDQRIIGECRECDDAPACWEGS